MLEGHPPRKLFSELIRRAFYHQLHYYDSDITAYLTELLVDFTHTDRLYTIRDASGHRLEDVGEMLIESNPLLAAGSFDREREVRKHSGDCTLFFTGLFPESLKRPRRTLRLDYFIDYVKAGKESYGVVSKFDQIEYRQIAPLFRRLSENFELCVFGLSCVRDELRRMQDQYYLHVERTFLY